VKKEVVGEGGAYKKDTFPGESGKVGEKTRASRGKKDGEKPKKN